MRASIREGRSCHRPTISVSVSAETNVSRKTEGTNAAIALIAKRELVYYLASLRRRTARLPRRPTVVGIHRSRLRSFRVSIPWVVRLTSLLDSKETRGGGEPWISPRTCEEWFSTAASPMLVRDRIKGAYISSGSCHTVLGEKAVGVNIQLGVRSPIPQVIVATTGWSRDYVTVLRHHPSQPPPMVIAF